MTIDALPPVQSRPVPGWVRTWAWATIAVSFTLVTLGGFVTTFRVGMADPVWPTEPWFLFSNQDWQFGFVIEHVHRLAGWIAGLMVTVLAFAVWRGEPDRRERVIGFVLLAVLLLAYGEFHRGFRSTSKQILELAKTELNIDAAAGGMEAALKDVRTASKIEWPWPAILITPLLAAAALAWVVRGAIAGKVGGWLRVLAVASLVAVMLQGLLGGFRVLLNPLMGSNLAAIHGGFGQIAFCGLVATAILCAPRRFGDSLHPDDSPAFTKLAWGLTGLLFVQLVWAIMLRHGGGGLAQRLHLLTAFVATAGVIWLAVKIIANPAARQVFGGASFQLIGILALQLILGVEAYLGKFAAIGPQAQTLPEARAVQPRQAIIRTGHQLIGCGLLASCVALAIRLGRVPALHIYQKTLQEAAIPDVAAMAMYLRDDGIIREGRLPDVAALALVPLDDGTPPEKATPDVAAMAMKPAEGMLR